MRFHQGLWFIGAQNCDMDIFLGIESNGDAGFWTKKVWNTEQQTDAVRCN